MIGLIRSLRLKLKGNDWKISKGKIPARIDGEVKLLDLNKTPFYREVLRKSNKIFDSGDANVYYVS